jgi:NTE family protein
MAVRPGLALLLVVCATTVSAETRRPKIGLALGGGGARGAAHVGILRALEEMHVPVDYVAGTSMGAVVGGLYASGMTTDEIEQALVTTDWRDALNDRTRYRDLSFRRKEDENRYLTAFEAGLRRGRFVLPSGLRSGQKLRFLLQSYVVPVATVHDFSKLPIPFKAVAADIETGEAVILDRGDLAEAIRASMSIPGVFSPMEINGKLLVDGGVANNLPVDVVRAMGADIVIAIDVGSPLLKREQIGSLLAVTGQVLTILTRQNTQRQIAAADIALVPPVSNFGTMAFEDAGAIVKIATEYGRAQRATFERLSIPAEEFAQHLAARPRRGPSARPIEYVTVEGSRRVDARIIRSQVRTKPGRAIDGEQLRRDVTRLYGLDDFQYVNVMMREEAGQYGLLIRLTDKPWGPTYARFGLNVIDDLEGDSSYNVVLSATRTRINALGAEWRNDLRMGRDVGITSEFYQPLDFRGRFFVAPSFYYFQTRFSVFDARQRVAVYDVNFQGAGLDAGIQFADWGAIRGGIFRGRAHAGIDAGEIGLPEGTINQGGFRGTLTIIRTDSPTIPRHGGSLVAQYLASRTQYGAAEAYSKLDVDGLYVMSRGRQSFLGGLAAGSSLGTTIPLYDEFPLGGLLTLGGFAEGQLHGQKYALLRFGTFTRLRTLSAQVGSGLYGGIVGEMGNVWEKGGDIDLDDMHRSLTLILAADTIVGPLLLGYGRADTSDERFYVTIGKTF